MIRPARHAAADFGERLRDACRPLHDQLDGLPALASLATRTPKVDDYHRLLAVMAGVVPALERVLGEALPQWALHEWVAALNRTRPLAADCAALGLAAGPALPPPRLDSRERCLAALYVLEGSRLGSQLMARNLRHASLAGGLPLSFLETASPAALGWPALLGLLRRCPADTPAAQRACATGVAIFQHLLHNLAATHYSSEVPA